MLESMWGKWEFELRFYTRICGYKSNAKPIILNPIEAILWKRGVGVGLRGVNVEGSLVGFLGFGLR